MAQAALNISSVCLHGYLLDVHAGCTAYAHACQWITCVRLILSWTGTVAMQHDSGYTRPVPPHVISMPSSTTKLHVASASVMIPDSRTLRNVAGHLWFKG